MQHATSLFTRNKKGSEYIYDIHAFIISFISLD